jgi:hypothetical protein
MPMYTWYIQNKTKDESNWGPCCEALLCILHKALNVIENNFVFPVLFNNFVPNSEDA